MIPDAMIRLTKITPVLCAALLFTLLLVYGGATGQAESFALPGLVHNDTGQMSAQDAAARVQERTGGRVLAVRRVGSGYRIKILTRQGSVRIIYVDARTGAMTPDY